MRKKIQYRLEYAAVRLLAFVLSALPYKLAIALGQNVGELASHLIGKRRRLVLSNLERALPDRSEAERRAIARATWRNLGRVAVEFIRIEEILAKPDRFLWPDDASFNAAVSHPNGGILLTGHFTNWELMGVAFQARIGRTMAIARPMKNPWVDSWIHAKRTQNGLKIALHRNAVKASLRWLKEGNRIGILADHNLYTGGTFVNFFGRPASSTTMPALLHLRTGAPITFFYLLREGDRFRIHLAPVPLPDVPEAERVQAITQAIATTIEEVVRRHPENWFWIHNRWKRQPDPVFPVAAVPA